MDYTIGPEIRKAPFHIATVRSPLTRNLAVRFGEVQDEIAAAYADLIPATEKGALTWYDIVSMMILIYSKSGWMYRPTPPSCRLSAGRATGFLSDFRYVNFPKIH